MNDILVIIFFILLFIPVNSFVLYPLVIFVISRFFKENKSTNEFMPKVSILIAAYNEEKVIEERLKNIRNLKYDFSKLEVLIGSDCSSDRTNEILLDKQKEYSWLKIFLFDKRRGKASVINDLIKLAKNDIVVFSDANTEFKPEALKNLVYSFKDEKIGGVCGKLVLTDDEVEKNESVEEKKYWIYETIIKESESRLGLLFAANGGIFAIRKNLFIDIPIEKAVTDDLFISLTVIGKGYKFVYAKDAIAVESVGKDVATEFKRKVRFSATNFQTMTICLTDIIKRGILITYAFFSHKISRWFLPFNMILIYLLNIFIFGYNTFVNITFYLQSLFYLFALLGYISSKIRFKFFLFSLPYFFVVANIAVLKGFFKYLNKKHSVIWETTKR